MAGEDVAQVQDVAAGNVQGDGTIRRIRGCNVTRKSDGEYDVQIDSENNAGPNVDAAESVSWVQPTGSLATQRKAELDHTSGSLKTIRITDAGGTPVDTDFEFRIGRLLG